MSTITELRINNVKGLSLVEIDATGREVLVIGGKNAAGKSCVLDSLVYLLTGGKSLPTTPLRDGTDKGGIYAVFDDGTTLTRTFTKSGATALRIKTADGLTGGQRWLDQRISKLMDPMSFARGDKPEDTRRRADLLRTISGLDLTGHDAEHDRLYAERTKIGKKGEAEKATLTNMGHYPDAPAELVDLAKLTAELTEAQRAHDDVARIDREAERHDAKAADLRADAQRLHAEIAELEPRASAEAAITEARATHRATVEASEATMQREIAEARARHDARVAAASDLLRRDEAGHAEAAARVSVMLDRLTRKAAQATLDADGLAVMARNARTDAAKRREQLPDLAAIRERIAGADSVNQQVRANAARKAAAEKVETLRAEYAAMSDRLAASKARRVELIAAAAMPVEGLGFSAKGTVTFNGVEFSQCSSAQRIRISFAIAIAADPEIRVMVIHDGSLLDDDSLALVMGMAKEHGVQLFIERVGTRDDGVIIIEDGRVLGVGVCEACSAPLIDGDCSVDCLGHDTPEDLFF